MEEERSVGGIIAAIAGGLAVIASLLVAAVVFVLSSAAAGQCQATVADPMVKYQSSDPSIQAAKAYFDQFPDDATAQSSRKLRLQNARTIITTGLNRKESDFKIAVAVATAIQESNLWDYGFLGAANDHNSCGVFQQQWDQGWGNSCAQVMDVTFASNQFYNHLDKVPILPGMSMKDIAIIVQNPSKAAYARWQWDDIATQTVKMFTENDPRQSGCYAGTNAGGWRNPLDPGYTISDYFGPRHDPYNPSQISYHYGVDLAVGLNTPIYAAHAGTVIIASYDGGFGNHVRIDDGDGIITGYGHMVRFAPGLVKGQHVESGQVIGYVGSTGHSTGSHLHFEILQNGKYIDPLPFMKSMGVTIG